MSFGALFGLGVFMVQELGMMLGVGGVTVLMVLHFRKQDDESAEHLTQSVIRASLVLVILSGLLITGAHLMADEASTVLQPAFLFKWFLIVLALLLLVFDSITGAPREVELAVAGATWYALFAIHTLAPADASWAVLIVSYAAWLLLAGVFFGLAALAHTWGGGLRLISKKKEPESKTTELSPPVLKPALKVVRPPPPPAQPAPPTFVPAPAAKMPPMPPPPKPAESKPKFTSFTKPAPAPAPTSPLSGIPTHTPSMPPPSTEEEKKAMPHIKTMPRTPSEIQSEPASSVHITPW